jgi:hypothetical protein
MEDIEEAVSSTGIGLSAGKFPVRWIHLGQRHVRHLGEAEGQRDEKASKEDSVLNTEHPTQPREDRSFTARPLVGIRRYQGGPLVGSHSRMSGGRAGGAEGGWEDDEVSGRVATILTILFMRSFTRSLRELVKQGTTWA